MDVDDSQRRNLVPEPGESAFLPGMTQSGKSTLCRFLASWYSETANTIILDTKPSRIYDDWGEILTSPKEALDLLAGYHRVVYRPEFRYRSKEAFDRFYLELFQMAQRRRQEFGVVTDEVHHVLDTEPGEGVTRLQTQGAELGIMRMWGTQRPARIPLWSYTESDRWYVFRLIAKSDQKRMADAMGMSDFSPPVKHRFVYWNQLEDLPPEEMGPLPIG